MTTTTVGGDGRIALGPEIMEHLGASAGAKLCICKLEKGVVALERAAKPAAISDVFGMLKRCGQRPIPIEEMNGVTVEIWTLAR